MGWMLNEGVLSEAILLLMVYHSMARNAAEKIFGRVVADVLLSAAENTY